MYLIFDVFIIFIVFFNPGQSLFRRNAKCCFLAFIYSSVLKDMFKNKIILVMHTFCATCINYKFAKITHLFIYCSTYTSKHSELSIICVMFQRIFYTTSLTNNILSTDR